VYFWLHNISTSELLGTHEYLYHFECKLTFVAATKSLRVTAWTGRA